ncbi:MAG: class I SAM-dependent methyltransferase [Oscillospiraceae bacterium]|jgi:ubiquinone/menaquinone biosynthesis C-methylase UbiE|nr:class I SAM-dependent methyltransferase [Oscillospiraceae bacterium]
MNYNNFAAFYDRLQEADYDEIGRYYCSRLRANNINGGILLDLACGTGTLSRYFADLDYDVIGADISSEMLSIAAKKPHERIQYLCQDMTELDLYGTVDCCICVLDGLNHLPDLITLRQVFSRVSLFMNSGGVFAFDMNTLYKHEKLLAGNTFVYDLEDLYCVWRNSDCEGGRVEMTLDVFSKHHDVWQRSVKTLSETAYPLEEITKILEETGFGNIKVFDWLSEESANELSEKAVFTAVKDKIIIN